MSETFAYDAVDYPAHVHPQLHPSRLGAIGRLHGLAVASPGECALLEVGCGDGVQLLALAQAYPRSRFVGVDLSSNAIARGEAMRARLGLDNLRLVAADIARWSPGAHAFDFIVAHGFYSWVPEPVRESLMRLCGAHLAASGLACISYNTLPGGHLRRMLWDTMRFHAGGAATPAERIARALECLDLLELGMPDTPRHAHYTVALRQEIRVLRDRLQPHVLFHDDLADINDPCTLDQFLRHAREHGLGFLAEASYHEMSLQNAHADARPLLAGIAADDVATKEQYLDFLTGRRFRQTLLVRAGARMRPQPAPAALSGLELVSALRPEPAADAGGRGDVHFRHPDGGGLATPAAVLQALLEAAGRQYPAPLDVDELVLEARASAPGAAAPDEDRRLAHAFLLRAFEAGLVELHLDAPRFAATVADRPHASPLARAMAAAGHALVPSLRPHMVRLPEPWARALLCRLDGTLDRGGLLAWGRQAVASGELPTTGAPIDAALDEALQAFLALSLLQLPDGPTPCPAGTQRTT